LRDECQKKLNLFKAPHRSAKDRLDLLNSLDDPTLTPTQDYFEFGKEYFDTPGLQRGYSGYYYDGRYADTARSIATHYGLTSGSTVLEIGCAKGFLLVEFLKIGVGVVGVDRSNYAVSNAHPDVKQFITVSKSIDAQLPDEVDLSIAKEVLSHMPLDEVISTITRLREIAKNRLYVVSTVSDQHTDAKVMKDWDPTFITNLKKQEWNELFAKYDPEAYFQFSVII